MKYFEKRKKEIQSKITLAQTFIPESIIKIIHLLNAMIEEKTIEIEKELPNLIKEIEKHPEIVCELLKIANSPLWGVTRKIATVKDAILTIGLKNLKYIIYSTTILQHADNADKKFPELKEHLLWTGICASEIATQMNFKKTEINEIYICALIHDIGKIIIQNLFPPQKLKTFQKLTQNLVPGTKKYLDLEKTLFGACHCELGACVTDLWHFPKTLTIPIFLHHFIHLENEIQYEKNILSYTLIISLADKLYYLKTEYNKYKHNKKLYEELFEPIKDFYKDFYLETKNTFITEDFINNIEKLVNKTLT